MCGQGAGTSCPLALQRNTSARAGSSLRAGLKNAVSRDKTPTPSLAVPAAPASRAGGESPPCLEHPDTPREPAPNFRAPQPRCAVPVPLAAVGQEQLSRGLPCPGRGMLCESGAESCSWKMEGEGDGATLGDLTTKEDTMAPRALLFYMKQSPGVIQEDCSEQWGGREVWTRARRQQELLEKQRLECSGRQPTSLRSCTLTKKTSPQEKKKTKTGDKKHCTETTHVIIREHLEET